MLDLDDNVPLSVKTTDAAGTAANPTTIVLTITLPDLTTVTPAVTTNPVGTHTVNYTATQSGRHRVAWKATGANLSAYADVFNIESNEWRGLVSLADAKRHLGKSATLTTDDEELRRFILAATDFIESRIGPVAQRSITTTAYPSGGMIFLTPPVISVASMTYAHGYVGTVDVAGIYLDGEAGIIRPAYASTFAYPVTVTYVGGRAIVPALIQQAALDYVQWRWKSQRGAGGVPIAGGEYEVTTPATVPYEILQALEPYMTVAIA